MSPHLILAHLISSVVSLAQLVSPRVALLAELVYFLIFQQLFISTSNIAARNKIRYTPVKYVENAITFLDSLLVMGLLAMLQRLGSL